jgi:polysaccharide export outer membrane protein
VTKVEVRRVIVVATVVSLACAGTPITPGAPTHLAEYHVAPPDVLAITLRPEPVISRQVTVRPDGYISFDLIGDLRVEGRTINEIREDITTQIREFIVSPQVSVELLQSNSRQFFMFGEVQRVGSFPLIGRVTAIEALAQAGGPTRLADLNDSRLVRLTPEGQGVYSIRYGDILKRADATTDHELQPGDVITVPAGLPGAVGNALQAILYPVQAIIGLGGRFIRP